ncbi:hypothetical protein [Pseudoalteromonas sp. S16_S37]|uniref:hypothetical protein n=1 Tax=Pseudoalteromonas sp. S16_S37 TaxID=2720228 RepID=UPI001681A930|nr:hypothetical protein [Pseudoalteromonas sp. S16_S37]MBD1581468.1 hypothetical protein [Pseudoalteromonas sp. S16_S37]
MKKRYLLLAVGTTLTLIAMYYLLGDSKVQAVGAVGTAKLSKHLMVAPPNAALPTPPIPIQKVTQPNDEAKPASYAPSEQEVEVYIPPIGQSVTSDSYQGDLDDYESYQAYGDEQERKLKQAFIIAAKDKVKRLEALLQRGREEGISEEELTFAENKIAGIKQMSEQLQQELSEEN